MSFFTKIISNKKKRIVVFCGGEGVSELSQILKDFDDIHVDYLVPVSDNGGSSWEIMKRLKKPAIGDIRKRLTDVAGDNSATGLAIARFLKFRLDENNLDIARRQWFAITNWQHEICRDIPDEAKGLLKQYVNFFDYQIKMHAPEFDFKNASIGNCFFAGAIMQIGLLSTIWLFTKIAHIKDINVIPILDIEEPVTIGATLENGDIIYGQNEISHPGRVVDKECDIPLSSRIKEIFYYNIYNDSNNQQPRKNLFANRQALEALEDADKIIYSVGSYWTSLQPLFVVPGVGEAVAASKAQKIEIQNGYSDREIFGMSGWELTKGIQNGLNRFGAISNSLSDYVNKKLYIKKGNIFVNADDYLPSGIELVPLAGIYSGNNKWKYDFSDAVRYILD